MTYLEGEVPTLRDFAIRYIQHIRDIVKRRSWRRYEYSLNHLIELYGDKEFSEITPQDIDDYKGYRLKDALPATINIELSALRQLFKLAERWKQFHGKNPVSVSRLLPVENIKERILTGVEEDRLLSFCNLHLAPIVKTALQTGMRKTEILTLKWTDVDFDNGLIMIRQTNSKNKKMRKVPVNSSLRGLLLEQKLKTGGSGFVFLSNSDRPYKD